MPVHSSENTTKERRRREQHKETEEIEEDGAKQGEEAGCMKQLSGPCDHQAIICISGVEHGMSPIQRQTCDEPTQQHDALTRKHPRQRGEVLL